MKEKRRPSTNVQDTAFARVTIAEYLNDARAFLSSKN